MRKGSFLTNDCANKCPRKRQGRFTLTHSFGCSNLFKARQFTGNRKVWQLREKNKADMTRWRASVVSALPAVSGHSQYTSRAKSEMGGACSSVSPGA